MKVIAVIERPAVIRRILDHLGLPTAAPQLRAPPDSPDALAAHQPREWSDERVFDLPVLCSLSSCNAQAGGAARQAGARIAGGKAWPVPSGLPLLHDPRDSA